MSSIHFPTSNYVLLRQNKAGGGLATVPEEIHDASFVMKQTLGLTWALAVINLHHVGDESCSLEALETSEELMEAIIIADQTSVASIMLADRPCTLLASSKHSLISRSTLLPLWSTLALTIIPERILEVQSSLTRPPSPDRDSRLQCWKMLTSLGQRVKLVLRL
jgi:hypothetical protein